MVSVRSSARDRRERPRQPYRDVLGVSIPLAPDWWVELGGSEPEYYVFRALERRGLRHGIDFIYQAPHSGGRLTAGGAIVDFELVVPRMAINVQSLYYHGRTADQRTHDRLIQAMLVKVGLRIEYITEVEAINAPDEAVADAIAGLRSKGPIGV